MKKLIVAMVLLGSMMLALPAQAALVGTFNPPACSAGYVNISFDDGPTQYTPVLLSKLQQAGIKVTFFDVGDRLLQYPTYAKSELNGGHQIANHTQSHGDLTQSVSPISDLVRSQYILIQQTGTVPTFYRPPYGATAPGVRTDVSQLGLTEIIWTVDTVDWSGVPTAAIVASVKLAKAGDFVLMHDGYTNTINAIPQIATDLKARGLCAGKIVTSTTPTQAWENLSFDANVTKF